MFNHNCALIILKKGVKSFMFMRESSEKRFACLRWNFNLEEHSMPEFSIGLRTSPKTVPLIYLVPVLVLSPYSFSLHLRAPFCTVHTNPFRFISMTVRLNLNLCPRYYLWTSRERESISLMSFPEILWPVPLIPLSFPTPKNCWHLLFARNEIFARTII